jgi:hypothetical protein
MHWNEADQLLDKKVARLSGFRCPGSENSVRQFGDGYRGKRQVERAVNTENALDEVRNSVPVSLGSDRRAGIQN